MKTAVVYGANLREAKRLTAWLEARGWQVRPVCRKEEVEAVGDALDLLVVQIDPSYDKPDGVAGSGHDYEAMADRISEKVYEAVWVVEQYLPALSAGGKRIAFLTEKCGSIRLCGDRDQYVRHMILAGVHMQAKLLYNRLRKDGFTMRLYAAEEEETEGSISAGAYVTMDLCYDPKEPYIHSEENRFVMRDGRFEEIPW